jgi:hypothetical protein
VKLLLPWKEAALYTSLRGEGRGDGGGAAVELLLLLLPLGVSESLSIPGGCDTAAEDLIEEVVKDEDAVAWATATTS